VSTVESGILVNYRRLNGLPRLIKCKSDQPTASFRVVGARMVMAWLSLAETEAWLSSSSRTGELLCKEEGARRDIWLIMVLRIRDHLNICTKLTKPTYGSQRLRSECSRHCAVFDKNISFLIKILVELQITTRNASGENFVSVNSKPKETLPNRQCEPSPLGRSGIKNHI